jgi:hypothetical protein
METYYCKRYRRASPGATTGTVTDEMKFTAENVTDAVRSLKWGFQLGIARMDWEKDFATLEDASGHVVTTWLDGASFA